MQYVCSTMMTISSLEQNVLTHIGSAKRELASQPGWLREHPGTIGRALSIERHLQFAAGNIVRICRLTGERFPVVAHRLRLDAAIQERMLKVPGRAARALRELVPLTQLETETEITRLQREIDVLRGQLKPEPWDTA